MTAGTAASRAAAIVRSDFERTSVATLRPSPPRNQIESRPLHLECEFGNRQFASLTAAENILDVDEEVDIVAVRNDRD